MSRPMNTRVVGGQYSRCVVTKSISRPWRQRSLAGSRRGALLQGAKRPPASAAAKKTIAQPCRRHVLLGTFCPCCCACCTPKKRNKLYDKYFAFSMANVMAAYEAAVQPVKQQLFDKMMTEKNLDNVLEVGVGTAPNLEYYQSNSQRMKIVGVDPNTEMEDYAMQNAAKAGFSSNFQFVKGSLGALPFEDDKFDAAVMTLVLCSVPSQVEALQDLRRVLKPGGKLYLVEHVIAPQQKKLLRFTQHLLTPVQQLVADGCHLDRNTLSSLVTAGFDVSNIENIEVEGAGILAPHIAGWAVA